MQAATVSRFDFDPSQKLRMLRQYQTAWANMNLKVAKVVKPLPTSSSPPECFGGIFAYHDFNVEKLMLYQLPSVVRNIPWREWSVQAIDDNILRDFAIDPSQDLLIFIENSPLAPGMFRFHRMALSSGQHHELTESTSPIQHEDTDHYRFTLRVCARSLAALFVGEAELGRLVIWDWQTGQRKQIFEHTPIRHFAFMDEEHILLATYLRDEQSRIYPGLSVLDLLHDASQAQGSARIAYTLAFPPLTREAQAHSMKIFADPSPAHQPHHSLQTPFCIPTNARIFIIVLWNINDTPINIIAHGRQLRSFAKSPHTSSSGVIHWDKWGPSSTRLVPDSFISNSGASRREATYGEKYVGIMASDSSYRHKIQFFDFNQETFRCTLANQNRRGNWEFWPANRPSTLKAGFFAEDLVTRLPCRQMYRIIQTPSPLLSIIFAEDCLILEISGSTYHVYSLCVNAFRLDM
ncbi:hypothetical protein ONZ45_g16497 [Pleurotus djamor]|nr:hypothetical protein ONZ45_g16497 [Pleurotus djamor]